MSTDLLLCACTVPLHLCSLCFLGTGSERAAGPVREHSACAITSTRDVCNPLGRSYVEIKPLLLGGGRWQRGVSEALQCPPLPSGDKELLPPLWAPVWSSASPGWETSPAPRSIFPRNIAEVCILVPAFHPSQETGVHLFSPLFELSQTFSNPDGLLHSTRDEKAILGRLFPLVAPTPFPSLASLQQELPSLPQQLPVQGRQAVCAHKPTWDVHQCKPQSVFNATD